MVYAGSVSAVIRENMRVCREELTPTGQTHSPPVSPAHLPPFVLEHLPCPQVDLPLNQQLFFQHRQLLKVRRRNRAEPPPGTLSVLRRAKPPKSNALRSCTRRIVIGIPAPSESSEIERDSSQGRVAPGDSLKGARERETRLQSERRLGGNSTARGLVRDKCFDVGARRWRRGSRRGSWG